MINKDVCESLARKNGNEILIWSWNNSSGRQICSLNYHFSNIALGKIRFA